MAENHPSNFPTATASDHHGRNSNGDGGCKPEEHGSDDHDCIHMYLRPGEALELCKRHIVPPVRMAGNQFAWVNIIIRDQIGQKPDKVGVYDNSLPFDVKEHQWIGQQALSLAKALKSPNDRLFTFTMEEFRKTFTRLGAKLGVMNLHPYQLRHGGATQDLTSHVRDFNGVKSRGRWKTDSSVRRYAKVGRVQQLLNQLPDSSRSFLPVEPQEPGESLHRSLSTSNRERLVPIDVFTMQDRPHRFALEIFAGSSRLCNALNDHKVVCFPVDNCLFESHNVLHKQIEEKLSFWIRSGRISMVWLGMPCTTFSRARKTMVWARGLYVLIFIFGVCQNSTIVIAERLKMVIGCWLF